MTSYLLDTNILLRSVDPNSENCSLARNAVNKIIEEGGNCYITPQILVEFWVVATRPINVNGLGWTTQKTQEEINEFLSQFSLLVETADIFLFWLNLVSEYDIKGKRTHDIRLIAVMKTYNITHLLTFNPTDFIPIPNITILRPQDLIQ